VLALGTPDWKDLVQMDFAALLRNSRQRYAANAAVWYEGREQTYAELFERACRLANALAGLGLEKGDRVAMLGANCAETVEQIAGIALGGYVRVALYAHQTGEVNAYLTDLVGARVLIAHESHIHDLQSHLDPLPTLEHVIVYGGEASAYE
jgi:acyl-CoA synthetase (AMP-forming)/AMP-acid ligase II